MIITAKFYYLKKYFTCLVNCSCVIMMIPDAEDSTLTNLSQFALALELLTSALEASDPEITTYPPTLAPNTITINIP